MEETPVVGPSILEQSYEELLDSDARWALSQGSLHFDEKSAVFHALRKIAKRLQDMGVPYAVVGGMALFRHGLRRFTEDVDILVTRDDLRKIHDKLEGLGYVPPFARSKHLRDVEYKVKIEFLTTGEYPGDGKPKPVAFPDPRLVSFESEGISYLQLPVLIELKLASGMTNLGRLKDLADVLELIKILNLPADFADQLNPFVRGKFAELWGQGRRRYVTLWRNKWLTTRANTIEEMIVALRRAADELEAMRSDGVTLQEEGGTSDDYAYLVTSDPEIAKKHDMHEESEYWGAEDGESEDLEENPEDEKGEANQG